MSAGEFTGRSIVVTGGSLGMGRACAERFARAGGRVLVVSNDAASVDEAVEAIGPNASGFVGDVRKAGDMERAVAEAVSRHGGVDAVACCAGVCVAFIAPSIGSPGRQALSRAIVAQAPSRRRQPAPDLHRWQRQRFAK